MLVACKAADVTTEMIGSTDSVVQSSGFAWSCCYSPVLTLWFGQNGLFVMDAV